MGWIANLFILTGHILVGRKKKQGFIASFIGNGIYTYIAISKREIDWLILCIAFSGIAIYNYLRWDKEEAKTKSLVNATPKGVL